MNMMNALLVSKHDWQRFSVLKLTLWFSISTKDTFEKERWLCHCSIWRYRIFQIFPRLVNMLGTSVCLHFTIMFMKPLTLSSFFHYGRPIYLWKDCMWLVVVIFAVGFALSLIFGFFGVFWPFNCCMPCRCWCHSIVACVVLFLSLSLAASLEFQICLSPMSRITEQSRF